MSVQEVDEHTLDGLRDTADRVECFGAFADAARACGLTHDEARDLWEGRQPSNETMGAIDDEHFVIADTSRDESFLKTSLEDAIPVEKHR